MKGDRNKSNLEENKEISNLVGECENAGFRKIIIDGFPYFSPNIVKRKRCFTYNPEGGCLYCGNKTFRYYSTVRKKKYYQCEKCGGINH
jgi:hypothetical protein